MYRFALKRMSATIFEKRVTSVLYGVVAPGGGKKDISVLRTEAEEVGNIVSTCWSAERGLLLSMKNAPCS